MLNLEKNKHYLLACSFGPDSMALFDMLLKEGYKFSVAHVNYHLRKEANEEESKLRDFCFDHRIGIYVKDVDEGLGDSHLEKKCRDIRYNFFINVVKENHFDALLVAHQEDDLIETFLMQKRRKNLVNYFGIKEISYFSDIEIIRHLKRLFCAGYLLHSCKGIDTHSLGFVAVADHIPVAFLADDLVRIKAPRSVFLLAQRAIEEIHGDVEFDCFEHGIENYIVDIGERV